MLPDRVSNPGPLTYESGVLPIALRGPARIGLLNFSICMLGLRTTFIMEDNGFKILVYNL